LENAYAPGSPERRQAFALRVQLTAREGKLAEAEAELQQFRRAYPDAPELDAIAAALANTMLDKNDIDRAEETVKGVTGPRTGLARSRVALRRGNVPDAKSALLMAAPALHGAEATDAIKLATVLGRVSREGGELMGQALARSSGGAPGGPWRCSCKGLVHYRARSAAILEWRLRLRSGVNWIRKPRRCAALSLTITPVAGAPRLAGTGPDAIAQI
jgi:hypothetical protein